MFRQSEPEQRLQFARLLNVLKRNTQGVPVRLRRIPSILALLGLCLSGAAGLRATGVAQDDQSSTKFSVKTYSTLMEVRVFDSEGNFIPGLGEDDFQVVVNSKARELLSFKEEKQVPTSLGILIDIGSSMGEDDIRKAKQAIEDLIHLLPRRDEILLGVYNRDVDFLSSLTTDRPEVLEGLRNVSPSGRVGFWKRLSSAFGTAALTGYAIDETLLRLKSARYQNKVVLVFSAAFGNLGRGTEDHLREAGARLFAVGWKNSLGDAFNLWGDKTSQKELLKRSAGAKYSGPSILERLDRLKTAMSSFYLLAYAPTDEDNDDEDVEIRVVGHPGYRISSLRRTAGQNAFY